MKNLILFVAILIGCATPTQAETPKFSVKLVSCYLVPVICILDNSIEDWSEPKKYLFVCGAGEQPTENAIKVCERWNHQGFPDNLDARSIVEVIDTWDKE